VRRVAVRTLEAGGYRVLVARDGEEAVAVFRSRAAEIAAVVLDVVMPRRGGVSALAEMRALRPTLPAIFCSGYAGEVGDVREPWLQKPYEPDLLLAELRRAIDGGGSAA
jgi:CheY-like chemotaxis protein